MIKSIKKLLPNTFKRYLKNSILAIITKLFNANPITYSQTGEDIILRNIFNYKENGFYVDVGAYHPINLSNTCFFYTIKNWRGINIDACPGSMNVFNNIRKRDINIEAAISDEMSELIYYVIDKFNTMNSFSKEFLEKHNVFDKVTEEIPIKTKRLDAVLDKYLPVNTKIDFLSVDAESKDLNVLRSNNWAKYRPKIILVELDNSSISEIQTHNIVKFMDSVDYEIISIVYQSAKEKNVFFEDIHQKEV